MSPDRPQAAVAKDVTDEELEAKFPTSNVLESWAKGIDAEWPPPLPPPTAELQFKAGDACEAWLGAAWRKATVTRVWYREKSWPKDEYLPYKLKLFRSGKETRETGVPASRDPDIPSGRRRRGCDADIPWSRVAATPRRRRIRGGRVAATPRLRRGYSVFTSRGDVSVGDESRSTPRLRFSREGPSRPMLAASARAAAGVAAVARPQVRADDFARAAERARRGVEEARAREPEEKKEARARRQGARGARAREGARGRGAAAERCITRRPSSIVFAASARWRSLKDGGANAPAGPPFKARQRDRHDDGLRHDADVPRTAEAPRPQALARQVEGPGQRD